MENRVEEALRYLGAGKNAPPELYRQTQQIMEKLQKRMQARYVYRVCSLVHQEEGLLLPETGLLLPGKLAARVLEDCSRVVLLACTIGTDFDTLLRREEARDMASAVILDACGGVLVEEGCDKAEEEIRDRFPDVYLTDRFSPGYGDLPIELQPALCDAVNAFRRIGITVGKSMLMNPCKSVTALIGLASKPQPAKIRGCAYCSMKDSCRYQHQGC